MGLSLLVILVVMLIAAVVLLRIGMVGRTIDDHPWCTACRFDLYGLDRPLTCPECGANVERRDAVRVGQRRRRRGPIWMGIILIGISALLFGAVLWSRASAVGWRTYAPVWCLSIEARANDTKALDELNKRLGAGSLSAAQAQAIVSDALAVQSDTKRTWSRGWGNFIERARTQGAVSQADWKRYAEQAAANVCTLVVRKKVRHGDPIPHRLVISGARVGNGDVLWLQTTLNTVQIGELRTRQGLGSGRMISPGGSGWFGNCFYLRPEEWDKITVGRHTLKVIVACEVRERGTVSKGRNNGPLISKQDVTYTFPFEVVPEDQPTVTVNEDPALKQAVENAITNVRIETRKSGPHVILNVAPRPLDVAFDVYLCERKGKQREVKFGGVAIGARRATRRSIPGNEGKVKDLDFSAMDVVLRPNVELGKWNVDVVNIWGEQIVLEDVPIKEAE